jgi:DNA-binding MarR family transcriptional regulator
MSEELKRLFLREKPVLAIIAISELKPAYAAVIAKRIDSTFPHTSAIITELETHGLIQSRLDGRIRYLELTDRGKAVARALHDLTSILQRPDALILKLGRLREMAEPQDGTVSALRLGPLRRDIAKLKGQGDAEPEKAASDLDSQIVDALEKMVIR